ncbi:DUF805 domain-containing protein [Coraliomargarita sp. W4R72]
MFTLLNLIVSIALILIEEVLEIAPGVDQYVFAGVYGVLVAIPGWAVTVRRLHDTNRSGWWWLLMLLPAIGPLILLLFTVQEGTDGENEYGLDPI